MLEELVGSTWHRFITRRADASYPAATVYLDDVRHTAGVFFRALGGEGGFMGTVLILSNPIYTFTFRYINH